jgi:peptide/nickel transport system substrate-binding protein
MVTNPRCPFRSTDAVLYPSRGRLSRRALLRTGTVVGLTPLLTQTSRDPSLLRGASAQAPAATLTIGQVESPFDLDPHSNYEYVAARVIRGAYEGLIALKGGATDEYDGLIAERWESNVDRSVWTFHLRQGVTFQDGSPCDAQAVRASYERLLSLGKGPSRILGRFVSDPQQITAPDDKTVEFTLDRPQPLFEAAMASLYGNPVVNVNVARAHEQEDDWGTAWLQTHADGAGTGPYRIVEFEPGERAVLEWYEGYWGGWEGTHFDTIVIRTVPEVETLRQLLEHGDVDILDRWSIRHETLPTLEEHPDIQVDAQTSSEVEYFILTETGPLAAPEARQAMCYAFPYREVIEGVFRGYAKQAAGPVAEKVRGFAPETFQYTTDLTKAKELFAQAGVTEGTELRLMQPMEGDQAPAQLFQANLAEIGIQLSIEAVDFGTYLAIFFGDTPAEERPHVMRWSWQPDYNDAWTLLDQTVSCHAWGSFGGNAGFYCNERVDELLTQAEETTTAETYEAALAEAQQILSRDDPAAIYYAQPEWVTVLRRDVAGFVFNPIYIGTYDLHKLHRTQ